MNPRILCAGIGNIFFSDDGFGVEVANRLSRLPVPDCVRVEDYGIRGVHLAYELCNGYDALVLIDAMPMGDEPPGTVVILEPDAPPSSADDDEIAPIMDAHTMSPLVVLTTLANLGGSVDRILVVGCQPATIEEGMGLSEPVSAAVDRAVEMVSDLLTELVGDLLTDACQPAGTGRETRRT
ncbi:MAG TPA: hydrogenase maturation protease [Acidimicrobiales bacterium]|jgi:hydrogenase maturation protease|nr:hydrogenase maturation protease [Acidimicrobiales bacterium]